MARTVLIAAGFAAALVMSAPAQAGDKPVELTAAQLATAQSRTYAVPANTAFNATLAALQTLGYLDVQANRDAGTVSGITESKAKMIYNIIWGLGKKKYTQKASLLVEEMSSGTQVRLNLHVNETKARGIFGTSFSDGKLVKVGEPYAEFFTALDSEIARRAAPPALSPAPAATPAAAPVAAAPAASAQ